MSPHTNAWPPEARRRAIALAPRGAHMRWPSTRVVDDEDGYRLVTPGAKGGLNEVLFVRCEGSVEAEVARRLADYRALGVPWKWVVAFDSTPEDTLLEVVGREAEDSWGACGMCLSTSAPATFTASAAAQVESAHGALAAYDRAAAKAWGVPVGAEALERSIERGYRYFFVRDRSAVVAFAAYQAKPDGSAYFTSAFVEPAFRGRGLYRGLVARRLQAAREEGLTLVTTQARLQTSAPILERLGFSTEYTFQMFSGS